MLQVKDRVWVFALIGLTKVHDDLVDAGVPTVEKFSGKLEELDQLLKEHIQNREDNVPLFKSVGSARAVEEALKSAIEELATLSTKYDLFEIMGRNGISF